MTFQKDFVEASTEFDDRLEDAAGSHYNTFQSKLKRFVRYIYDNQYYLKAVSSLPTVDFQTWYQTALGTVRGMVGSGKLDWPENDKENLAMRIQLIRHIADGKEDVPNFCSKFMYSGSYFNDMIYEFADQLLRPTARDLQKLAIKLHENQLPESVPKEQPERLHKAWYERPLGIIGIGLLITIVGGLVIARLTGQL